MGEKRLTILSEHEANIIAAYRKGAEINIWYYSAEDEAEAAELVSDFGEPKLEQARDVNPTLFWAEHNNEETRISVSAFYKEKSTC